MQPLRSLFKSDSEYWTKFDPIDEKEALEGPELDTESHSQATSALTVPVALETTTNKQQQILQDTVNHESCTMWDIIQGCP